jgi:transcriptional regulator with XRE-family HTH domain
MKKKTEKKPPELPPLCAAVKSLREKLGDSQERFARRVGVAVMTISRFENGRMEPRDPRVLHSLSNLALGKAGEAGFGPSTDEYRLFDEAYTDYKRTKFSAQEVSKIEQYDGGQPRISNLREWRMLCAFRLAMVYFPEAAAAMEVAAGDAGAIVRGVRSQFGGAEMDYSRLEREAFVLAELRLADAEVGEKQ